MSRESAGVWLLALGQTLGYAALYYAFAALLPHLIEETGWPKTTLALGPTLGYLVAAALAPFAGRLVDRGFARALLTLGPLVGAALLAALALAPGPAAWLGLWALMGLTQASSLYETCFAYLTLRFGAEARARIVHVTLVAGFAGTLAFPLGAFAARQMGGQHALFAFAALMLLAAAANRTGTTWLGPAETALPPRRSTALRRALRSPQFWVLAVYTFLIWLNHAVLTTFALLTFAERGASPAMAVLAASLMGPAQVLGRFGLMLGGARFATFPTLAAVSAGFILAPGLLWAAGTAPWLIFAFVALQGASGGIASILRPVLALEVLGRAEFGALWGAVAVFPLLANAASPYLGAHLMAWGSTPLLLTACLAMALTGAMLARWLARHAGNA